MKKTLAKWVNLPFEIEGFERAEATHGWKPPYLNHKDLYIWYKVPYFLNPSRHFFFFFFELSRETIFEEEQASGMDLSF